MLFCLLQLLRKMFLITTARTNIFFYFILRIFVFKPQLFKISLCACLIIWIADKICLAFVCFMNNITALLLEMPHKISPYDCHYVKVTQKILRCVPQSNMNLTYRFWVTKSLKKVLKTYLIKKVLKKVNLFKKFSKNWSC